MPQLDSSSFISQIFWLFISFGLLYLLIAKFVFPSTSFVLFSRSKKIDDDLKLAQDLNEEAENIKKECDNLLQEAKDQARDIILAAEHANNMLSENSLHELEHHLHNKAKKATRELVELKKALLPEVKLVEQDLIQQINKKILTGA